MSKRQHEEEEAVATFNQEEEPANKMQKPNEQPSSSEQVVQPVVTKSKKVPVTVLTGFLGAGKSTLLNYILSHNHGYKIAIIENEFGEVSIDDALIVTSKEEVVELSNGCLCCTLRGDLIGALNKLSQKKDKFDYIVIETTGLALPGPIIQTFYLDEQVRDQYYLDGIVTVVDSKHILQHLHHHHHEKKHGEEEDEEEEEENEAEDQIAFADRIIVNKIELIDEEAKKKVLKKIRKINGLSPVCETNHSKIDLSFILNIRAFDIDRVLNMDPNLLKEMDEHQHDKEHKHEHKHEHHDAEVTSYAIVKPGIVDKEKFEDWLLDLLTERGLDIYRTKGILNVGEPKPLVVQAVHSLLDMRFFGEWKNSDTTNKLVFIGKYLEHEELIQGFNECLKE